MSKAKQKWDQRYLNKLQGEGETCLPQAPDFLVQHWDRLSKNRVLDLGAGEGAASLFLAEKGFSVCAVDISAVGLGILESRIAPMSTSFKTVVLDLESESTDLSGLGDFDSIVISRYKPVDTLWHELILALRPEGTLMITTFNRRHHEKTGFPLRFCLQPNEFLGRFSELKLIHREADLADSDMDSYLFRKIPS